MDLFENRDFSPMLLSEEKDAFDSKDFIFELKFDGTRALIFVSQNNLVVINRHGKNITYLYPELQEIKNYIKEKVIFDGEFIILGFLLVLLVGGGEYSGAFLRKSNANIYLSFYLAYIYYRCKFLEKKGVSNERAI